MASTRNRVIAGDYKKRKVVIKHTYPGKKAAIKLGWIHMYKKIPLDKSTVESYEVVDESRALAANSWGRHIISIQFKNGRRSLIEVTDKIYRVIMTTLY